MSDSGAGDIFDLDRLRGLIELMKEHELGELDLEQDSQRIRLRRGASGAVAPAAAPAPAPAAPAAAPAESAEPDNIVYIKSHMVGTFYARPNPDDPPFCKVGDNVDPETTVCLVEAMKTFNPLEAGVRGQVVAVLVEDGEPVDHDKPLFKVDTSR